MKKNILLNLIIFSSVILLTFGYLKIGQYIMPEKSILFYSIIVGIIEELIVFIPAYTLYKLDKNKNLGKLFLYYFIGKLAFIGMEIYIRDLNLLYMLIIGAIHITYALLFSEISQKFNNIFIGLILVMIIHFIYDFIIYSINDILLYGIIVIILFIYAIMFLMFLIAYIKEYYSFLIYEYEYEYE